MKQLKIALLIGASLALSAVSQAQAYRPDILHGYYVNYVQNPGFENSTVAPWVDASYMETDEFQYIDLGYPTTSMHHLGSKSWDMNIAESNYNQLFVSIVKQSFSTPFSSNLTDAYVWVAANSQTIYVNVNYTDGTASSGSFDIELYNAAPNSDGWQMYNFLSIVKPNKLVSSIEFSAVGSLGEDIFIDDVTMDKFFPYYSPVLGF